MSIRSHTIQQLCEDLRGVYQILITPRENGVMVRFNDDTLGNRDLRFPPIQMSHDDFFKVIDHNPLTMATYQNALERGDTYGIFVDGRVISRLAQWGFPETKQVHFQTAMNKRFPTDPDFERARMMSGRV